MRSRAPFTFAALSASVLAGALLSAPSSAAHERGGWTPYRQPDIQYAAGERCEFAVHGNVERDREEFKDMSHWPNGQVRAQLWRGALVITWTNLATGEAVVRDQSARAVAHYRSDGSMESLTSLGGSFGAGLPAGSHPAKGAYIVSGRGSSVLHDLDGTRTIVLGPRGSLENLCQTLG